MQAILIFITLHLVMLLSSINSSAISVAFPNITASYNTSLVLAGWVLSIYQLVAVCAMVLMGKVSDVLGRKKTFLICTGLFVTGSIFAALSPNIILLILSRFIQSVGGGGILPATMGIIVEQFPRNRHQAIGISMSIFNIGGIIGPNIGGWLVTSFGWKSIFWFNVPFGILAMIPLFLLLKSEPGKKSHIDFAGAGYFSAFLFSFMIGLSQLAHSESSTEWLITAALFAASALFIAIFIRHELKAREPVVELDLFRLKPFAAANVYNFIFGACIFGFSSFIPLYAVAVYNMTTIQSSYVLMARAIGMIVAATTSGFFLVNWGYRKPMLLGSVIISLCLLLLGAEFSGFNFLGNEINSVVLISAITLVMGLGTGIATPASNNACLDLMPHRASTITGVRGMFRQSGGAIGIAIITLILQYVGNLTTGFHIVFLSTGIIVLITVPFIFAMPDRAAPVTSGAQT